MKTTGLFRTCSTALLQSMFFVTISLIVFSSCKNTYTATNFEEITRDHKVVAVLPFEMVYMGIPPKDLTEEEIQMVEEAESKAFQISFHNEILRSTRGVRGKIRIDLQPYWS